MTVTNRYLHLVTHLPAATSNDVRDAMTYTFKQPIPLSSWSRFMLEMMILTISLDLCHPVWKVRPCCEKIQRSEQMADATPRYALDREVKDETKGR